MQEKIYKIHNIDFSPLPPDEEEFKRLWASASTQDAIRRAQESYLPWEEFRKKSWVPGRKEDVWSLIRLQRRFNSAQTPILDKEGEFYTFNPRSHVQFLHEVDLELGGNFMGVSDFSPGDCRRIIRRNLIEESIASSKLEGANTSREVARKMLHEGRRPRTRDERMIVNNHEAMTRIEEELKNEPLSAELLKDLHRQVTRGTLGNEALEGVLRETFDEKGNRLKIMPWDEETVTYITPDKDFVESELPRLIDFANDRGNTIFIHPLIKAIMLHFWIGLLHPFEDGNGRLARILFYWYMLKRGYWAFSYLSLSERIIKSPKQYAMAYIYAEQDSYDLNYFIHYNIAKLKLARQQFRKYLEERISENRQAIKIIQSGHHFNLRQLNLLQYLARDEQRYTTLAGYHGDNADIGKVTAASDLKKLVEMDFLRKVRSGRKVYYYPTPRIRSIIR